MKRAWKTFLVACAVVAASLATAAGASAAPILSITSDNVSIGDTFTLQVRIADASALAAYSFSVLFDPSILSVVSVEDEAGTVFENHSEGPLFVESTAIDNVGGTVKNISAILLTPEFGFTGEGLLASVTFNALAAGTSAVTPYFDQTEQPPLDLMYDATFLVIEPVFAAGAVTVRGTTPPVPEPVSAAMLALGLGATLARRRRSISARSNMHR